VTEVPGTTRDLVTENVDLAGLRVMLVDTAGLRSTSEIVESEGVARARQAHAVADLTIVVLDRSRPRDGTDLDIMHQTVDNKRLIVINKIDLPAAWPEGELPSAHLVSAATGRGLSELRHRVAASLDVDLTADRPAITNIRHIALVQRAHEAMTRARDAALAEGGALSEEFVLADLQEARAALEEIGGHRTSGDVLAHIFSRFCVGK
jgi:tRNA modification GTPase